MKYSSTIVFILWFVFTLDSIAQDTGWEVVQSNTIEDLNSIYFYDHQFGIACGNSGVMLKSVDSGKTWQSLASPVNINLNDCVLFSEDCMMTVGDSASLVLTSDGGDSWFYDQILGLSSDIYSLSFAPRTNDFYDGIYGADSQKIMTGSSIICVGVINDITAGSLGGFYATYMLSPNIGFVAGENSISQPIVGRLNNYPQGWDFVSFYLDGNEGRATGVAFTDSLIGYISAIVWDGRGAIAKSTDNGDTWTPEFFSHPLLSISFPLNGTNQVGYCVGDSGTILKTFNAGESWHQQFSNTSERLNKVFFIDSECGFAVGDNGTILRTTNGGGITSIHQDETSVIDKFELQQNYPNPFNPTTNIRFQISHPGFVSLNVYDVLGNEVAVLVDEYRPSGKYEEKFDASDLSSGLYFYKLQVGNFVETKKMILLK